MFKNGSEVRAVYYANSSVRL